MKFNKRFKGCFNVKKNIFFKSLIVLTVLICSLSSTLSFAAPLYGDVNFDNSVNSLDFAFFRTYLLGNNNLNDTTTADLNGDGNANSIDFAFLRQYLLGQIDKFPAVSTNTSIPIYTSIITPTSPTPTPVLDDMNYVSDTKSIHIKKYEQGNGQDMITYYVADVKISEGSDILSAFAKGTFGRSITDKTSNIAKENDAIFAVNGSYYGFRDDGIEIRNGKIYRDEPLRTGLAIYKNGTMESYTETDDSAEKLMENGVFQAISFGPSLVKAGNLITDFTNTVIDINSSSWAAKRPIEGENPRTGVGILEPNHFVFIVVDGRSPGYSRGATLAELAKMFYELGCNEAYNLDGGGSSTMYFNGKIINKPSLGSERSISDILYITK